MTLRRFYVLYYLAFGCSVLGCSAERAVTKAGNSTAAVADKIAAVIDPPPTPESAAVKSMVAAGVDMVQAAIELWRARHSLPDAGVDLDAPPFAP